MAGYGTRYDDTIYDAPTFTGAGDATTTGTAVPRQPPVTRTPPTTTPVTTTPVDTTTPSTTTPTTTPTTTTTPKFDYRNALDWVRAQYDKNKTANPGLLTENPPEYWAQRIAEDNGQHDEAYWAYRMSVPTAQYFAGSGSGGSGGTFDLSGVNLSNLFDDPATTGLMNFLQTRIGQLTTPINDPNAAILQQAILDAMARLNKIQDTPPPAAVAPPQVAPLTAPPELPDLSPKFDALIKAIQDSTSSLSGPTAQYRGILDKLVSDLSKPAFSDDQLAQLKTAAVDTLTHEHQQSLDNKVRAMGMQGIPPSSGIAQEALKNVDAQYQTLKAQALQAQNVAEIAQINERRQQLMQAASSALTASQQQAAQEQAALTAQMNLLMNQRTQDINLRGQNIEQATSAQQLALTQRQQELNRLQNEAQRLMDLRSQDINTTTGSISLAQALEQLSRGQRTEQNANLNTALQLFGIPVQLSSDRLSQALQVLGLGGNSTSPSQLLTALTGISNQANVGNQTNTTNSTNWGALIGNLIANAGKK